MIQRISRTPNSYESATEAWPDISFPCAGSVRLQCIEVFSDPTSPLCREFLERVAAVPVIDRLIIRPTSGSVELRYAAERWACGQVLEEVWRALTVPRLDGNCPVSRHLHLHRAGDASITVRRHGDSFTTWEVVHELPGRIRLRHEDLLGRPDLARDLQRELGRFFGVDSASASSRTGTLLVNYNAERTAPGRLVEIAESILRDFYGRGRSTEQPTLGLTKTTAVLALAAATDLAFPILTPASALILLWMNLGNFRAAFDELRRLRPGPATVYTAITGCTLATGFFSAAALMSWLVEFWDRRCLHRVTTTKDQFLAELRRSSHARLCTSQGERLEPVSQIVPGDIVAVNTDELIPVDGRVVAGTGLVDERLVRGAKELSEKVVGDRVYASSLLCHGAITIQVTQAEAGTRAAAIGQLVESATSVPSVPLRQHGKRVAEISAAPTLAAATVGLFVGEVTTALAILRPDYATGPGMTQPLGDLEDLASGLREGFVVRNVEAFSRLGDASVLLLDHPEQIELDDWVDSQSPVNGLTQGLAWRKAITHLRNRYGIRVGLMSHAGSSDVRAFAEFCGMDFSCGNLSTSAKAHFVKSCTDAGQRVALISDCRNNYSAAEFAHVSISLGDVEQHEQDPADVFLLRPSLAGIVRLWDVSRRRKQRVVTNTGWTLLPNLCCVAGAFALGFTGLHTVVLTNLGTYAVYRTSTRWLRRQRAGFDDAPVTERLRNH